jgi:hypothetical protein
MNQPEEKKMSELIEMILQFLNSDDSSSLVKKTMMPVIHHENMKEKGKYTFIRNVRVLLTIRSFS